jgi:phosphoglucomutase
MPKGNGHPTPRAPSPSQGLLGALHAQGAPAGAKVAGLGEAMASGELDLDSASFARVLEWAADPEARSQIEALVAKKAWPEIRDAFSQDLSFGTAGLRGKMGVGPNRMNERNVAVATEALALEIEAHGKKDRGVVIAWDTRNGSDAYAALTAKILSAHGIKVYTFKSERPMPEMSFAIRKTGALAGVMITASHNPREYNGYKVSWDHGGQIGKEIADSILKRRQKVSPSEIATQGGSEPIALGDGMDEEYISSISSHVLEKGLMSQLRVLYDPLYGAGRKILPEALARGGVNPKNITVLAEHADAPKGHTLGDFVGISSPNPSSKGVLDLAISRAKEVGADLVLATDPDADRLVAAVKDKSGGFTIMRANDLWPIVLDHRLATLKARGEIPENAAVVRSWVTSALIDAVASSYGVPTVETPTGFKWIAEVMVERPVLGGFEESDGMSIGTHTREKCGQLAGVVVAEAAAAAKAKGKTLLDVRDDLFAKHGKYEAIVEDLTFEGVEGRQAIQRVKETLAKKPEALWKGAGAENRYDGTRVKLEDGTTITVRPSGTEPKIKIYVEKIGEGAKDIMSEARSRIEALAKAG